ncbi:hypothetical protein FB45DRAFT_1053451, partial [Roridomyces roridus]
MAEAVILNNFRVAHQILCRNVQRAIASHGGDNSVLDAQALEVAQCFRAAEMRKEVFPPEEYATLVRSVNRMVLCLMEARSTAAAAAPEPSVVDSEERTCTEMHRTWRIPEIVQEIVSHFDSTDLPATRAQLAYLARTSRIFHEQALDGLWKHTSTMVNLIKCMPSDLWEAQSIQRRTVITLCRPIVATDWERVLQYSHRVKTLAVQPKTTEDLTQVYDFLLHSTIPGQHLLPNLVALLCPGYHNDPISPTHLSLFITPRLRDIEISTFHISLFPALTQLPDLQTVVVQKQPSMPGTQQQHVSTLIRSLRNLQSLDTPFVDLPALVHLGKLQTLTALKISPMPVVPYSTMHDQGLFSSLVFADMFFEASDEQLVPEFIRTWTNPPLSSFTVTMAKTLSEQALCAVSAALSEHVDHKSLRTLSVKHHVRERGEALTGDIFRPLVCFVNLTMVYILADNGYNLDDALMTELARAWPHLETLNLETIWNDHRQAPLITLFSLRTLASHCPRLRELELTFDANSVPEPRPNERQLQFELASLDAAHSPISSAIDVARYLSAVFPNLTTVCSAYDEYDMEEEMETEEDKAEFKWSALWREVKALLPALNDIRAEEYEWGRQSIHMSEYMTFEFP